MPSTGSRRRLAATIRRNLYGEGRIAAEHTKDEWISARCFDTSSTQADRPCYVDFGQGQSPFVVSSNNTVASKRMDTNVLSVAILLPQRYPYESGMRPSA